MGIGARILKEEFLNNHEDIKKKILQERKYISIPDFIKYYEIEYNGKTYKGYGLEDKNGSIHLRQLDSQVKEICLGPSTYSKIVFESKYKPIEKTCYVVEGMMDAIALVQHKIPVEQPILVLNGVMNADKIKDEIKKYDRVVIMTDTDKAGREAAQRIIAATTNRQDVFVAVSYGEGNKDPDEMYRTGQAVKLVQVRKKVREEER